MKKLPTGSIVFDTIDIICISFSAGCAIAYIVKLYRTNKKIRQMEDPIVTELKRESPITMVSEKGTPLRLPLIRGGEIESIDKIKGLILIIRNRRFNQLVLKIRENQKKLKLLKNIFFALNVFLINCTGLGVAVGGSITYTDIVLFGLPSTLGGFLLGMATAYPLAIALVPLAILYGRGIEDIPDQRCRFICKFAEQYHNEQLGIEMKEVDSTVKKVADAIQLPLDKQPLICVEEKLSLVQRFKLRQIREAADKEKMRRRIQYFSEFIKKFPECGPDQDSVYQQIVQQIDE